MWDRCGMARTAQGLREALDDIRALREEFWRDARVLGVDDEVNQQLERAGRVADFLELGELMCRDALTREESCGGHFREEHQTPKGMPGATTHGFSHVAVWEYAGAGTEARRHIEQLVFDSVPLTQRSYK